MTIRKGSSIVFGITVLAALLVQASAQLREQSARERASDIARAQLRAAVNLKPDQFVGVQRDEALEQSLALAVGRTGAVFIYRASPSGDEIRRDVVVHHVSTDADLTYIIAVSTGRGSTYRIHGFGLTESLAEFERLMAALNMRVSSPGQAEALAEFYRKVNPGNHEALTPIVRLMELKQAAERQCQGGGRSFDAGEKAFNNWWKHAEPLYATLSFQQRALLHGSGYLVEWIVLSSSSDENCGGVPLRAQLEIGSDGRVGKLTFSPVMKG